MATMPTQPRHAAMTISRRHFVRSAAAVSLGFSGLQCSAPNATAPTVVDADVDPLPDDPERIIALPEGSGWLSERLGWPTLAVPNGRTAGYVLLACALGLLLYCSRAFVRLGKGTIVPIDAPRSLVRTGIYRFSRNPIYIGYVAILVADFIRNGQLGRLILSLIHI